MTQLFISHSSKNNPEALALSQWLTAEGWDDQFLDIDPQRGITAGERWEKALHQAAGRCDAVLFLVSPDWLRSDWCRREFTIAQQLGKRLFVLLLDGAKRADVEASMKEIWQLVDLSRGDDHSAREVTLPDETRTRHVYFSRAALMRLREGLKKAGLDPQSFPWPPSDEPNRAPYRGLAPLEAQDAGIFFGREAPITELLAQLRGLREAAPPRFLAILGASGAGKSSFLRAGILPRLARDDRHFLPLPVIRPERAVLSGSNGLVECLWTVRRERKLNWSKPQIKEAVATGAAALQALLQELAQHCQVPEWDGSPPQPPSLVLAIDQAEELFQAEGAEQAGSFLSLLAGLLQAVTPKLIVLCTIRSDSYEPLQSAPALVDITQRVFSLPPMPHGAFRQVIEAPVALLKHSPRPLRIEPQLTEALLRDIAEGGAKDALPLLAFTLERLYVDYSADDQLSLKDYQDLGRIAGAIEKAVAAALEHAQRNPKLPNDRGECMRLLRRGLVPWMAGIDRHSNLPYRKVALLSQVPEEARALIEHFVEFRLLAKDRNPRGEITIEPAHEALLRQWTILRGWLEEDAAALATVESVKAASRDWDANARSVEWLAHAAGRLEDAEALNRRVDLAANLDPVDQIYLAECRSYENERRDRELRQARELAEQRQRLVQRTRSGLMVASALLVTAVVAGLVAWKAQLKAQSGLNQAAERALGRAREKIHSNEEVTASAYLAESLRFNQGIAAEHSATALQRAASPALTRRLEHVEGVMLAAFANEEKLIVTSARDQYVRVWDAERLRVIGDPIPQGGIVPVHRFGLSGNRMVTAVGGSVVKVFDLSDGSGRYFLGDLQEIEGVRINSNGSLAISFGGDLIEIFDVVSGARILKLPHQDVHAAEFSPSGGLVASTSRKKLNVWDSASGELIASVDGDDFGFLNAASFSPDESKVVLSEGNVFRIVGLSSMSFEGAGFRHAFGHLLGRSTPRRVMNFVVYSPDGNRIVTLSDGANGQIWDVKSGRKLGEALDHDEDSAEDWINSIAFSPDGRRLVSSSTDQVGSNTVAIWDAWSGQVVGEKFHHDAFIRTVGFSRDSVRVLSSSEDGDARVWTIYTQGADHQVLRKRFLPIRHAVWRTGNSIVLSDGLGVEVWDVDTGEKFSREAIGVLGLCADIGIFAKPVSLSQKNVIEAFGIEPAEALGPPMHHEYAVSDVSFNRGCTRVATVGDRFVQVWEIRSGQPVGSPFSHEFHVIAAEISPSGKKIASIGLLEDQVLIRDAMSGEVVAVLAHPGVASVKFSGDGAMIVTIGRSKMNLWDATTGAAVGGSIDVGVLDRFAAISHDLKRAVSVGRKAAQIWDLESLGPIGGAIPTEDDTRLAEFSPDDSKIFIAELAGIHVVDSVNSFWLGAAVTPENLAVLSGRQVSGNGVIEWIPGSEWMALINRERARAEVGGTRKDQLMRWHFAEPAKRTLSPFSQFTVPQHIEREIDWVLEHPQTRDSDGPNYSPKILDDAYNLDPGHPLILLALSVFEDRPETKALWKRLSFPRFEKDARLAARAAEILLIDKDPENARRAAEIALALPSATESDKAKAQTVLAKINSSESS